jgi:polyhydroxybutyrate depolymerase
MPSRAVAGTAGCRVAPVSDTVVMTLRSGGRRRSALVHVPPGAAAGQRLPIVLAFHPSGSGSNGAFMAAYTGLSVVGDGEGFLAVYPNSTGGPWNQSSTAPNAPDDVRFTSDLLDVLEDRWCIDPRRVYATGVSAGGGMVARLGCRLSTRIAAIAPVAGSYAGLPPCHPDRPVSVLEIHGTSDSAVPYAGSGPKGLGSVPSFLAGWRARDGCSARATQRHIAPHTLQIDATRCSQGTAVRHIQILGGWHQYPGASPPDRGPRATISAAWQSWRFFGGKRLTAKPARASR